MTDFRGNIDHWIRQAEPDYYVFFVNLEKCVLLLERNTQLFFRLGISRTDRKNEGNYYAF